MEDLFQLSADMGVEVDIAVLDSLQEVACQLHILFETEEATIGHPSCLSPPDMIEAHLLLGHIAGDTAEVK